jgi:hypothetical protein
LRPRRHDRVRADAPVRPRGREKKYKNIKKIEIFLVVVAGLERKRIFSIFNFQFSIFGFRFSIPKLPELRGLHGRSREKKIFSA